MEEPTKKCSNCSRAPQALDQFTNTETGRVFSKCAKCREKGRRNDKTEKRREAHNKLQNEKKYYKEWREKKLQENPDEYRAHINEIHREWKRNNSTYIAVWNRKNANARLNSMKYSAQTRNITWELDDELAKKMMTSSCVYCGHLDLEVRMNGIDRMDSSRGYISDNCVPCCKNCNLMKGTYDPLTFIERCKLIAQCSYIFPDDVKTCSDNRFAPKVGI